MYHVRQHKSQKNVPVVPIKQAFTYLSLSLRCFCLGQVIIDSVPVLSSKIASVTYLLLQPSLQQLILSMDKVGVLLLLDQLSLQAPVFRLHRVDVFIQGPMYWLLNTFTQGNP